MIFYIYIIYDIIYIFDFILYIYETIIYIYKYIYINMILYCLYIYMYYIYMDSTKDWSCSGSMSIYQSVT
jgi:hypothetical protein